MRAFHSLLTRSGVAEANLSRWCGSRARAAVVSGFALLGIDLFCSCRGPCLLCVGASFITAGRVFPVRLVR